jgi:radical SAM superfamily enzyme YgiQ (UPF0313 family)
LSERRPKILLVNPWIDDFAAYDFWVKPIGLLSVGAALRTSGCDLRLLDCMDRHRPGPPHPGGIPRLKNLADGTGHFQKETLPKPEPLRTVPRRYSRYGMAMESVRLELARIPVPDCILVTSGMTYWYPAVTGMIALLREHYPGVPVLLGGIYATLCESHARAFSGADRVIAGEGEIQALEAVGSIIGLAVDASRFSSPDDVPDVPYDLYPNLRSAVLLTSRGCPFRCPFCASPLLNREHRRRSPRAVVDEIERLHRARGVVDFAFYDDALLYRSETHLLPMLEELSGKSLPVRLHTPNGMHPAWMDSRTAGLLKRTGFQTIWLSYETSDPGRQESIGGKVTDEALERSVRLLREAGFDATGLGAYVIMGLPDQSLGEVAHSLASVFSLGIRISLASFSPIPGTPSHADAVRAGILAADSDPLLTNPYAFLTMSRPAEYSKFVRLRTLAADGNGMLKLGRRPMNDAAFRKALREIEG